MKISIFVSSDPTLTSLKDRVQTAIRAENDGFDGVWYAQLFGEDALTTIAIAGSRTSRIELGTAVVPTFTRHPWVMAQQALTTQVATGGRLTLGVGLSHRITVETNFGLAFERLTGHATEYISVVRALIHEGYVDFTGKQYRVSGTMDIADATPCPILVAALGPQMLNVAGRLADGTITWMVGRKTLSTHIVPQISAAAREAGRSDIRICVGVPIAVANKDAARAEIQSRFGSYSRLPSYKKMLAIEGGDVADIAVVGDETEVERELRDYAEAGATDILATIVPVGDDPETSSRRTRNLLRSLIGKI